MPGPGMTAKISVASRKARRWSVEGIDGSWVRSYLTMRRRRMPAISTRAARLERDRLKLPIAGHCEEQRRSNPSSSKTPSRSELMTDGSFDRSDHALVVGRSGRGDILQPPPDLVIRER